jgi:hypothetical protein
MAVQSAEQRDQIIHWIAEQIPFCRIETLCKEREWEVPTRKELWHLGEHNKEVIGTVRETWQTQMWKTGLANKEARLAKELALFDTLTDLALDEEKTDYSGKPKYAMRDLINLAELIGRETGQIGTGVGADDNRFQVLVQNIFQGVKEGNHATIAVGTEGRLLSPGGLPTDERASIEGSLVNVAPVPVVRRRRQRKVIPDGEGSGTARLVSTGDEGRADN